MYQEIKYTLEAWSEITVSDIEKNTNFIALLKLREILKQHFPDRIAEEISLCTKINLPEGLGHDELEEIVQSFAEMIIKVDTALLGNGFGIDAMSKMASRLTLELEG